MRTLPSTSLARQVPHTPEVQEYGTSGVCGTCRAKLVEGKVRMERNFALDKKEVAAGYVLTCQAHPTTERVVLSFDDR